MGGGGKVVISAYGGWGRNGGKCLIYKEIQFVLVIFP